MGSYWIILAKKANKKKLKPTKVRHCQVIQYPTCFRISSPFKYWMSCSTQLVQYPLTIGPLNFFEQQIVHVLWNKNPPCCSPTASIYFKFQCCWLEQVQLDSHHLKKCEIPIIWLWKKFRYPSNWMLNTKHRRRHLQFYGQSWPILGGPTNPGE